MRITNHTTQFAKSFVICLRDEKLGQIRVSSDVSLSDDNKWSKPTINWPGCGDKTGMDTETFMRALNIAVYLAQVLEHNISKTDVLAHLVSHSGFGMTLSDINIT